MALFKCKICGGSLEINEGQSVATCEYCGTKQTIPKLDDERRANLYDRANHFRRNNDFDKAMGIYETILNEDNSDAEAYWSLVLCRYGIEYVEDPLTHRRIPTVNRAQFTSVFDDEDYKSAIENADESQRQIYETEANAINEIQKGILAISQKEEPFDVFICYKETDHNGRRTQDSVLATELYHELTKEGFKVFFSRLTLEDKLGVAYEPYIFAALHSAKVMVVIGTRPENFSAVWVKNEWSRYLALIKNGAEKTLIPAYRDMDPYDLPEEFSHLQAQDMSKLGFMQDLIRGIKKIVYSETQKPTSIINQRIVEDRAEPVSNLKPILDRGFLFLEDGEWKKADEYFEKVLDADPQNAKAYIGKLMIDLKVKKQDLLLDQKKTFDNNGNYMKAIRFADKKTAGTLHGYIEAINTRNETERLDKIYFSALSSMNCAVTEDDYRAAAEKFSTISNYKDSEQLLQACRDRAKQIIYDEACSIMQTATSSNDFKRAETKFDTIPAYKDSNVLSKQCQEKRANALKKEKRTRFIVSLVFLPIVLLIVTLAILWITVIGPRNDKKIYTAAEALIDEGKYSDAYFLLYDINNRNTRAEKITELRKKVADKAYILGSQGKYAQAYNELIAVNCTDKDFPLLEVYSYMKDKNYDAAVSKGFTDIVIPDDVTSINKDTFGECKNLLTSVTIPNSVTTIEAFAFQKCERLTSVTLPDSITSIGTSAFRNCKSLTSVTIPNSVTTIGIYAFQNCESLTSVTLPDSITSIGTCAFQNCKSLTTITIPNSITKIDEYAFYYCTNLTSINFQGTCYEWSNIYKGSFWNQKIGLYKVSCTDGKIYPTD